MDGEWKNGKGDARGGETPITFFGHRFPSPNWGTYLFGRTDKNMGVCRYVLELGAHLTSVRVRSPDLKHFFLIISKIFNVFFQQFSMKIYKIFNADSRKKMLD